MKKKTFILALLFFCVSFAWLGINIYWVMQGYCSKQGLLIPSLFFIAGIGMMYNEFHKKKRKHLVDVNKHKIP